MGDRCPSGVLVMEISNSVVWAVAGNPEIEKGEKK